MSSRIVALSVDAQDPTRMARFWAAALGWNISDVVDDRDDRVALVPNDGTPFPIVFYRVDTPKTGQNNIHLDLTTTSLEDQQDVVARLESLGGRRIDIGQEPDATHVVMADPEGNELCVIEPDNTFLAGTGRLGAVNADGLKATGYFWSEVLGWPLMWDQDDETAIRSPDGTGPIIQWSGPPLMTKHGKNRIHLDIASPEGVDTEAERLVSLGATRVDIGQGDVDWAVLSDPDGNELCVVPET